MLFVFANHPKPSLSAFTCIYIYVYVYVHLYIYMYIYIFFGVAAFTYMCVAMYVPTLCAYAE